MKEMTKSERWTMMMYYACINLGTGELGPINREEYLYLVVTMVISLMLYSLFFSDIVVLVKTFSR